MDLSQKNFKQLLIGKDVDRTSNVTPDTLAEGEIALFTTAGKLITAATAGSIDKAIVMKGKGNGEVEISDVISKKNIQSALGKNGQAKVEQVTYVGYNGTSGEIDVINDNTYLLRFIFKSLLISSNRGEYLKTAAWKSSISGNTQEKVATGLQKSIVDTFSRESGKWIKAELVNSGTKTALGTGTATAATIVFTKGAKTVKGFADVDNATDNAALAVNELIGVNGSYGIIESIDTTSNTLTLKYAWQGETVTVNDTSVDRITVANKEDYGIKISGLPQESSVGRFQPYSVTFDLVAQDTFGETPITFDTASFVGTNTGEIVAEREFFYKGNQGDPYRYGRNTFAKTYRAENILYDAINISWTDPVENGALLNIPHKQLEIVIPATRSNNQFSVASTGIKAVFEAYLGVTLSL